MILGRPTAFWKVILVAHGAQMVMPFAATLRTLSLCLSLAHSLSFSRVLSLSEVVAPSHVVMPLAVVF